ncbi:MAG TPA: hypothetical protein VGK67_22715 [Myxococcales bacterium]
MDAGQPLADAGEVPDAAAEPPDAAAPGPDASIVQPTKQGWTFYGTANKGPSQVWGASMDEGGNLWVAGGREGLFLMKAGTTTFQHFGLDEGLHPWGEPYPGQSPVTSPFLDVLSVSGGPAGTVFVGYRGAGGNGNDGCEDNWDREDGIPPDPNIYKSGDADRVTLSGSGIQVTHYEISTGPNIVAAEPRGREKVCTIYRILYDAHSKSVWFGGNHGYAWGDPTGTLVQEHAHPLLNGYTATSTTEVALTNYYWGLAVEPTGDLWVGGMFRSQHCLAGMGGVGFFGTKANPGCESLGSLDSGAYAIDWWPDTVHVDSRPFQRTDDNVSGMSLAEDGSLWIGSFSNGLAHRKSDGTVEFITTGLIDPKRVSSVQVDPLDGSVWVGASKGGITRIQAGVFTAWDGSVLGSRTTGEIPDIQVDRSGARRRIVVAFKSGSVGVYEGP